MQRILDYSKKMQYTESQLQDYIADHDAVYPYCYLRLGIDYGNC